MKGAASHGSAGALARIVGWHAPETLCELQRGHAYHHRCTSHGALRLRNAHCAGMKKFFAVAAPKLEGLAHQLKRVRGF